MSEHEELEKLVAEAKRVAQAERPARENIDRLLTEAAERRAKRDSIERKRQHWKEEGERRDKLLSVFFIICFVIGILWFALVFAVALKYLFS